MTPQPCVAHGPGASVTGDPSSAPKVSVILPVYNVEDHLARCLDGLAAQTLDAIEVLVINDGSTDGTQRVIDEYVARYPNRFRAFWQEQSGPSVARNMAIGEARGDYLGFVDGDDAVDPQMFELLTQRAEETDADVVVCGYHAVELESGNRRYFRQGWSRDFGRSLIDSPALIPIIAPFAWNKIFRRRLVLDTGIRFPEGLLMADIPFTYQLMLEANKLEKVQRPLYSYSYLRAGSITHTYSPKKLDMFTTLSILNDYCAARPWYDMVYGGLLRLNLKHVYNRFIELPNYDGVAVKQRFVSLSRAHLDSYFPDWREHLDWLRRRAEPWRLPFLRYAVLARVYVLFPWRLHAAFDRHARLIGDAAAFLKRFGAERVIRLLYLRALKSRIADRTAVFCWGEGQVPGGSPLRLLRVLAERQTHTTTVVASSVDDARSVLSRHGLNARVVRAGSPAGVRLLATAQLVVSGGPLPNYFTRRDGQTYLNAMFGTPLRRSGRGVRGDLRTLSEVQGDVLKSDHLLLPSAQAARYLSDDLMLEPQYGGKVLVMPLPRCEVLGDRPTRERLRNALGAGDRTVIALIDSPEALPRRIDVESYAMQLEDRLGEIAAAIDADDSLLVVCPAMDVSGMLNESAYDAVRVMPRLWDRSELLCVADCLVTDFSDAVVEFAATGREIVLFAGHEESGGRRAPLHVDRDKLPFPIYDTSADVARHLAARSEFTAGSDYLAFARAHPSPIEPAASDNLLDVVLGAREAPAVNWVSTPVDLVFIPYLTKKGQKTFRQLLDEGYRRDDAVFIMSGHKHKAAAGAFLSTLYAEESVSVSYRVTTDRMLLNPVTAVQEWLRRRFGWRFSALEHAYLMEAKRMFGTTRVRSAIDFSGYDKFSALAEVIDRNANSGPL